ncbi:MAG TPA: outer membrane protein assembly factor BamA [Desulfobacteraceae bacterium]|nr:outer membrane protein assembly factor BamA [Desulfobacteraceae bacterium]
MVLKKVIGWVLGIILLSGVSFAAETVRVVVMPFDIYSKQDNSAYLKKDIADAIKKNLKSDGAVIVEPGIPGFSWETAQKNVENIQKICVQLGADLVIWGSLTRFEQKFSVDAKMLAAYGEKTPTLFYGEGENIETLPGIVKKMSREFSLKLFRRDKVAKVQVSGNKRIEADAIERIIKTKPGDVYLARSLSDDLKAVYAMGYFEDIRIESEDTSKGKVITFRVTEKPTIHNIRFKNNRAFEEDKLKENLTLKTGAILNLYNIQSNVRRLESMYRDKNYHNVRITYEVKPLDNNQADVEFIFDEGDKVRIRSINFVGNKAYGSKELKKVMKTSEKGFWSWLTSSGELNREDLNQDAARVAAFYQNKGYIQAKVGEPEVVFKDSQIEITIKIEEGLQYKVGKVNVSGDLLLSADKLLEKVNIRKETYFNREIVRGDILAITDIYSNDGYANAEISPKVDKNDKTLIVDIDYQIRKGKQVYFEKIIIGGNTKTRDKVIRRELQVYEDELYSGAKIKRGVRNLQRLDFFQDVKINTSKGSTDDKLILKLDVAEKPTGTFSFGGGYSSVENAFIMGSVAQRNLFGLGQILELRGQIGSVTQRYTLSFTEPWLFDIPLSAGFDIYNWKRDYDTYYRDSKGATVRFGYPVFDYTRLYLSYGYDVSDIEEVTEDASTLVLDMQGRYITSSVTTTLRYDSRDKAFNPTEGGDHSVSVQYAGIGGDVGFTKYIAEAGQYFPLFWGTTGLLHARGGAVQQTADKKLPDYERFYLGGINSLRGFRWSDVCLYDENGEKIGGTAFVQFNVEYIIPLIKEAGVVGVLFYDTGNVYDGYSNINFSGLRQTAGFGFRWYSPMGPLRIENGYILDPKEGESRSGRWEFTMGGAF